VGPEAPVGLERLVGQLDLVGLEHLAGRLGLVGLEHLAGRLGLVGLERLADRLGLEGRVVRLRLGGQGTPASRLGQAYRLDPGGRSYREDQAYRLDQWRHNWLGALTA
jgi:hypothetical protein